MPLWVSDTGNDPRATGSSVGTGLEGGAFIFPVMAEGRAIGVLSFASKDVRAPDERLIEVMGVIGSQVGQVLKRISAEGAMRESEARFRSLTALSADWYWEQDDQFRLTFMSRPLGERTGLNASAYLGRRRWDQPALNLSAADWEGHRAQLERHEPFRDFEMQRPAPGGGTRWLSISGEPVFDAAGLFKGYRGIGRDITERKRAEEQRAAQARYQTKIAHFGEAALASRGAEELIEQAVRYVLEGLGGGVVAYLERAGTERQVVVRCVDGLAGDASSKVLVYEHGEALAQVLDGGAARIAQLPYAWAGRREAVLAPVAHEHAARSVLCALPEAHLSLGPEETRFLAAAASVAPPCTVITQADSGKTFSMGLQSCDLLELTDTRGIHWETPAVSGDSVHLEPLPIASPVAGQFWRIVPDSLGDSTITALGRPICTGPICPQYVVLFQVTIRVLPSP